MTTIHLTGNEPLIRAIVAATFPDYTGRKIRLETASSVHTRSYWSEGSIDYFAFAVIDPASSAVRGFQVPQMNPFDHALHQAPAVDLASQANLVCVRHSISRGQDRGLTIIVHPTMLARNLFPVAAPEIDQDEARVLYYTRAYKSSYGGIKNYRQHSSGLTPAAWEAAKARLIARGLLNKAGALTIEGKNAAAGLRF